MGYNGHKAGMIIDDMISVRNSYRAEENALTVTMENSPQILASDLDVCDT